MYTLLVILAGVLISMGFMIMDRLKKIGQRQEEQHELLQELLRKSGSANSALVPEMLAAYIGVMSDSQNARYQLWLGGKEHEHFSIEEIEDLDKKLAAE